MAHWIKMRANLDTDPDVIAIATQLNIDELDVIGRLWKVWSWADEHSVDGNAVRVTSVTLDRYSKCSGFAAALRHVGWLAGVDGCLTFPRFDRHNGQSAKKRALGSKRVEHHRNAVSVTNVTQLALPEEKRVEKTKKEEGANGSRPAPALSDQEWRKGIAAEPAYAHINVADEFGKMLRWCEVHRKQSTRRRFIAWLNRIEKPLRAFAGTRKLRAAPAPIPTDDWTPDQIEDNKRKCDALKEKLRSDLAGTSA